MSNTVVVIGERQQMLSGDSYSLQEARAVEIPEGATPCLIQEFDSSGCFLYNHPYWPQPLPTPVHVPDLTDSVAYSICARSVETKIYSSEFDITSLMEEYSSQPHETVLEDHCRDVANGIYRACEMNFYAVVPADPGRAREMERAIVDELCGLVETVLARRFRELASTCRQAAEHLEQN